VNVIEAISEGDGFGAGGDEEKVSFQEARAGRTGDDNGVRVFEGAWPRMSSILWSARFFRMRWRSMSRLRARDA